MYTFINGINLYSIFELKFIMKIFFLVFIILLFTLHSASAQDKVSCYNNSFSLGVESSLPLGLFGNVYSFGIGATCKGNFKISNNVSLTLYTGYINYVLKSAYGSGNQGYIPLLNGVEFNISPAIYGSTQIGYTFYTEGQGAFTYSPGIGYKFGKHFTALVKYIGQVRSAINSSSIGVRGAYVFVK